MKTTKIKFSFRGKNQLPLFMVTKEYYTNNEITYVKVLFMIH